MTTIAARRSATVLMLSATVLATALATASATALIAIAVAPAAPADTGTEALDQYGGVKVRVAPPTGHFTRLKVGNRWVLVTPEGNAFWMLGVFLVDATGSIDDLKNSYANRIVAKYGTKPTWAQQTVKRLKAWGFNTLAEYATEYVLPTKSQYGHVNPEKMPYVALMRASYYGLRNQWNAAPGPVKDLIAGTDPAVYTGWRGNATPDAFDPNFEAYANAWARGTLEDARKSPWLIGFATDDADNIVGFGPGPEVPALRIHPHIAWLVLTGNFQQTANTSFGLVYTDTTVYAKHALRNLLKAKYRSIETLNGAWQARYTSWDSDGGWPSGTGLLDESGRSPWVGNDFNRLLKASPGVRADLDEFLYEFAKRYFSVTAGAIRKHAPGKLVFGPATLNGWGGLTRKEILRAAGESVDVLQAGVVTPQILELTARYAGGGPIVTWTGLVANSDSALWRYPGPRDSPNTQEDRGRIYASTVMREFTARTTEGVHQVVGTKLWAFTDSWGEKRNWGLVSFLDNAYDGREAARRAGRDQWGFATGGEERDYGDFLLAVRQVNFDIQRALATEMAGLRTSGATRSAGRP